MASTINHHPTIHYAQPEEYRFSHDSVFLARKVFEFLSGQDKYLEGMSRWRALDLCAGCGVVGMDLLFHFEKELGKTFSEFDFIEVQDIYVSYFEKNKEVLQTKTPLSLINQNYEVLETESFKHRYHLIVSNPPYFRRGQGALSPSEFKNRCRFFIDSDYEHFIRGICHSLVPGGCAFFLMRSLEDHGIDVALETQQLIIGDCDLQFLSEIRGTPVAVISKKL